jgi:glucose-6-phosphate 1-dehydrogenase
LDEFLKLSSYVDGQYDEDESFQKLEEALKKSGQKNRIFYMALPPSVFTTVATHLKKNNYSEGAINRIIVEKPFGKDLESSREMQKDLKAQFKEEEVRTKYSNNLVE